MALTYWISALVGFAVIGVIMFTMPRMIEDSWPLPVALDEDARLYDLRVQRGCPDAPYSVQYLLQRGFFEQKDPHSTLNVPARLFNETARAIADRATVHIVTSAGTDLRCNKGTLLSVGRVG